MEEVAQRFQSGIQCKPSDTFDASDHKRSFYILRRHAGTGESRGYISVEGSDAELNDGCYRTCCSVSE